MTLNTSFARSVRKSRFIPITFTNKNTPKIGDSKNKNLLLSASQKFLKSQQNDYIFNWIWLMKQLFQIKKKMASTAEPQLLFKHFFKTINNLEVNQEKKFFVSDFPGNLVKLIAKRFLIGTKFYSCFLCKKEKNRIPKSFIF